MVFTNIFNTTYHYGSVAIDYSKRVGAEVLRSAGVIKTEKPQITLPDKLQNLDVSKLVHTGSPLIRIAAISGAAAVVLGAYGAHTLPLKEDYEERKLIYETANRYHFFHTLALLGTPLCRYPKTTASVMCLGMILFCGACYYQALTGEKKIRGLAPFGGSCLIIGWLCMLL